MIKLYSLFPFRAILVKVKVIWSTFIASFTFYSTMFDCAKNKTETKTEKTKEGEN